MTEDDPTLGLDQQVWSHTEALPIMGMVTTGVLRRDPDRVDGLTLEIVQIDALLGTTHRSPRLVCRPVALHELHRVLTQLITEGEI